MRIYNCHCKIKLIKRLDKSILCHYNVNMNHVNNMIHINKMVTKVIFCIEDRFDTTMIHKIIGTDNILITREEVTKLCDSIIEKLNCLSGNDLTILLDFSSINFIALSMIKQIIYLWERVVRGEFGTKFVILHGMKTEVEEEFKIALTHERSAIMVYDSPLRLIGYLEDIDLNVWNCIINNKNGGVSADNVRNDFPGWSPSVCSNKLKKLYDKRIAMREKKGKGYVYSPIIVNMDLEP